MCIISTTKPFNKNQVSDLFESVGWTEDLSCDIAEALLRSSHLVTVWTNTKLVGLIRSMDDGIWSANIDCLVVHKSYWGKGIGTLLLTELLKNLSSIKYTNVSPDEVINNSFY